MTRITIFLCFICFEISSQTLNLNNTFFEESLRRAQLNGEIDSLISFTVRPIHANIFDFEKNIFNNEIYSPTALTFLKGKGKLKILPIDYVANYNTHHPYNRNNGSMIPNRGFQHLISAGIYFELGPLSIQFKPEYIYAENKDFDGFWEEHYDITWARRYSLWNRIDMPERFGTEKIKKNTLGQSSIRLNYKSLSVGISSENIWWGPSKRNGVLMSNNAKGFNHITLNSRRPIKTKIGNFEFQFVTGRLEPSGFDPPGTERTFGGSNIFVPKINQLSEQNDWRFFQGYTFTYSTKWIPGLHLGAIRWLQMYGTMFQGGYSWIAQANNGSTLGWFPIFGNFLRKNDKIEPYEKETDQAAGVFFRWLWEDSKAEIYGEFNFNDSKFNFRDLLSDSDHSRAVTLGVHKLFDTKNNSQIEFQWEWTQLEQTAGRLVRNAGSWYMHGRVYHGFTNNGEVIGAGIGPGSNSQYLSVSNLKKSKKIGFAIEIIDQDNDFYYLAFEDSKDFRRYWKDFNLHLFYQKKFPKFWGSFNLMYSRSLNYQWELTHNNDLPYYQPGRDVNNFHIDFKLTVPIEIKNEN
tara:strand:- start:12974 stop:14698 length:1725 start_codon:yes stop_codon:yes gene_type:complete